MAISGVQVITVKQLPDPDLAIPAGGAALTDAHTLSFSSPLALTPSALRLTGAAATGVVPVRLDIPTRWFGTVTAVLLRAEPVDRRVEIGR